MYFCATIHPTLCNTAHPRPLNYLEHYPAKRKHLYNICTTTAQRLRVQHCTIVIPMFCVRWVVWAKPSLLSRDSSRVRDHSRIEWATAGSRGTYCWFVDKGIICTIPSDDKKMHFLVVFFSKFFQSQSFLLKQLLVSKELNSSMSPSYICHY